MPTNFDYLISDPQFATFADAAISAEMVLPINPALCATACRTALEFAVKWVYSVDSSLAKPYEDKLVTLISTEDFKDLLPHGTARVATSTRRQPPLCTTSHSSRLLTRVRRTIKSGG